MNLTWNGPVGPDINYLVEYRLYPSSDPFTTFGIVHTNYAVVPDIPDGFYEIKISVVCGGEIKNTITTIGGVPACPLPVYTSFQILSDTVIYQTVRINFTDANTTVRVKVTRINDSLVFKDEIIGAIGYYDIQLPKSANEPFTYQVDIANICGETESAFVNMGMYTVQKIPQGFEIDYLSTCNCVGAETITFTDNTNTFVNPEFLPSGTYNIHISILKGACNQEGHLTVMGVSEDDIVFTSTQDVLPTTSYDFYVTDVNLEDGVELGSHLDNLIITFSC